MFCRRVLLWRHLLGHLECNQALPIDFIADTDFEFFDACEYVDLGQDDVGKSVEHVGVFDNEQVEPSTTTWSSCRGSIFVAFSWIHFPCSFSSSVTNGPSPTRVE